MRLPCATKIIIELCETVLLSLCKTNYNFIVTAIQNYYLINLVAMIAPYKIEKNIIKYLKYSR